MSKGEKHTSAGAPPASIDNCGNCRYWEKLKAEDHHLGICWIITSPQKFKNHFAHVSPAGEGCMVLTQGGFHCTLYKVKK